MDQDGDVRGPDTRRRGVIGDSSEASLLARIAELEEEIRVLQAELAERDAAAFRLGIDPAAGGEDVIADGTRGMERGVSRRGSRASGRGEAEV